MTISFFITLGLLQDFELSYLHPFQGLSVIVICVLAAIILHAKITPRLIIGSLLISAVLRWFHSVSRGHSAANAAKFIAAIWSAGGSAIFG